LGKEGAEKNIWSNMSRYWRSRTNEEVRQLYGELDIVREIKKRKTEMAGTCGEDE